MKKENNQKSLQEIISTYVEMAEEELNTRWKNWCLDLSKQEMFEVLGGLMARQVALATELVMSPNIWNEHIAPIILRSMVDNLINFAWIFEDPLDRSRKYILYGLGQEKLQLEHLKNQIKANGEDPENFPQVEAKENWINAQRYTFLTEVTIGSWSGIDVRKMAEEANCLEIYNYTYQPLSSATHNVWNYVGKFNLKICQNPLHKYHFIPYIPYLKPNLDLLFEASGLVERTFALFDEKTNNSQTPPSAHEEIIKMFEEKTDSSETDSNS